VRLLATRTALLARRPSCQKWSSLNLAAADRRAKNRRSPTLLPQAVAPAPKVYLSATNVYLQDELRGANESSFRRSKRRAESAAPQQRF